MFATFFIGADIFVTAPSPNIPNCPTPSRNIPNCPMGDAKGDDDNNNNACSRLLRIARVSDGIRPLLCSRPPDPTVMFLPPLLDADPPWDRSPKLLLDLSVEDNGLGGERNAHNPAYSPTTESTVKRSSCVLCLLPG